MRKRYTRKEIYDMLLTTGYPVTYANRDIEHLEFDESFIVFHLLSARRGYHADDRLGIMNRRVEVIFYSRNPTANLNEFMHKNFQTMPSTYSNMNNETDLFTTRYDFMIFSDYDW